MDGADLFIWHGYTEVLLDDHWVKVTPAFNVELCERFGVLPLDFDGEHDALFHPFTADGRAHMEYVGYRGTFDELPFEADHGRLPAGLPPGPGRGRRRSTPPSVIIPPS